MREQLSRDELIALVESIIRNDAGADEEEADRRIALFCASVPHPRASNLIFHPRLELGPDASALGAAEIVDRALAYKPIEFGPASDP